VATRAPPSQRQLPIGSSSKIRCSSALDRANGIRTAILESEIVAYEIDAEADDDSVIETFGRLNQQGVRLKPGDLAAAA